MAKTLLMVVLGSIAVSPTGILFGMLPMPVIVILCFPALGAVGYGVGGIVRSAPWGGKDTAAMISIGWVSIGAGFMLGMIVTRLIFDNFKVIGS